MNHDATKQTPIKNELMIVRIFTCWSEEKKVDIRYKNGGDIARSAMSFLHNTYICCSTM